MLLRSKETFYECLGQIIRLEVTKQTVEFSNKLRKMSVRTFRKKTLLAV